MVEERFVDDIPHTENNGFREDDTDGKPGREMVSVGGNVLVSFLQKFRLFFFLHKILHN